MRKYSVLFILLGMTLIIASCIHSDNVDTPQIILEEVYTHEYQDTIVDAIFDTATVDIETARSLGWTESFLSENMKGNSVEIVYPKVLITKNEVIFYNSGLMQTEKIERQILIEGINREKQYKDVSLKRDISISANNMRLLITKPNRIYLEEGFLEGDVSVYNSNGKIEWGVKNIPLANSDIKLASKGDYALLILPEIISGFPKYISKEGIKELAIGDELNETLSDFNVLFSNGDYYLVARDNRIKTSRIFKGNKEQITPLWTTDNYINNTMILDDKFIFSTQIDSEYRQRINVLSLCDDTHIMFEGSLELGEYEYVLLDNNILIVTFGRLISPNSYINSIIKYNVHTGKVTSKNEYTMNHRLGKPKLVGKALFFSSGDIYHLENQECEFSNMQKFKRFYYFNEQMYSITFTDDNIVTINRLK